MKIYLYQINMYRPNVLMYRGAYFYETPRITIQEKYMILVEIFEGFKTLYSFKYVMLIL